MAVKTITERLGMVMQSRNSILRAYESVKLLIGDTFDPVGVTEFIIHQNGASDELDKTRRLWP